MPIRATCQCGHSVSVPDEMAGKRGKCPKCKEILQIPAATAKSGSGKSSSGSAQAAKPAPKGVTAPASKSAPTAKASSPKGNAAPAGGGISSLFDEVGLVQKKGQICPACDAPIPPNSVLCVSCGFNFTEGRKLEGFEAAKTQMFGNVHLNEAAAMMEREKSTEDRLLGAGAPWWMMFSILIGIAVFIGGLAIKMNAATTGELSSIEFMRRIQEADYLTVLALTFGLAMTLTSMCAMFAILATAFKESAKQGLLCLFAPFYVIYYMFSRMFSMYLTTTVIIYWCSSIFGVAALMWALPKI